MVNEFHVTRDRRVFLGDIEIKGCHGFEVVVNAAEDPEVVLRVSVGSVTIDEYTDVWQVKQKEISRPPKDKPLVEA